MLSSFMARSGRVLVGLYRMRLRVSRRLYMKLRLCIANTIVLTLPLPMINCPMPGWPLIAIPCH